MPSLTSTLNIKNKSRAGEKILYIFDMADTDNKKIPLQNLLFLLLSLLFHIAIIAFFFTIPIGKRTLVEKKTFNLVELQRGFPQAAPAEPSQQKKQQSQPLREKPSQTVQQATPQEQPVPAQVQDAVPRPEVLTSSSDAASDIPSIPQGTAHPEPGPQTPATVSSPVASTPASSGSSQQGSTLGTVDAGAVGIKPVKVNCPDPMYPLITQDLGITGTVSVILTIDENGRVIDIIVEKSPHKSMTEEVLYTVKRWRFKPVEYKGQKVRVKGIQQEIDFIRENY